MNKEQAIEELLYQSGRHSDFNNIRWEKGFLGMLRPFRGDLIEDNLHKTVEAIYVLKEELRKKEVSKEILVSILGICHLGRAWTVHPEGMLQRNHLIRIEQVSQIEEWINHISYITFCLLDGADDVTAFEGYESDYKEQFNLLLNRYE